MRILTMYQIVKEGGSFKRLFRLVEAMLAQGWEVHYLSTRRFPVKQRNLRFHKIKEFKSAKVPLFPKFLPQAVLKTISLLREQDFDQMVVFGPAYGLVGWLLPYRIPLTIFVRGDWLEEERIKGRNIRLVRFMEKRAFKAADRVCTNSRDMKNKISERYRIPKARITVIPNEVPSVKAKRNPKSIIAYVGTLEKVKGVKHLIKGFAKAKTDKTLVIAGSGPEETKLRALAGGLGLGKRVKFLGWVRDMSKLYPTFDLVVIPSLYEGCPNAMLESLGYGVPCIGSSAGGIPEILKHKELMFKPGDAASLAKRIEWVLKNYKKAERLCAGRKKAFTFDWEKRCIEFLKNQ